jgi:hypothetical protein
MKQACSVWFEDDEINRSINNSPGTSVIVIGRKGGVPSLSHMDCQD